jgi:hypothetical protein
MPTTPYYYIISFELHSGTISLLWPHCIHYPLGYLPSTPRRSHIKKNDKKSTRDLFSCDNFTFHVQGCI